MRRISQAWRLAFILWLVMRLLTWAFSTALFYSGIAPLHSGYSYDISTLTEGLSGALWGIWMRWDGVYYDQILVNGYHFAPKLSVYFPLYPMLARPLLALGLHPIPALIIVSNLALLAALGIFLQEVEERLGKDAMLPAGLALLLLPTAYYFFAPYPQSLALLLILLAWRFAHRRKWLACAGIGLLSGLAHSTVVPLAALLLIEVIAWLRTASGRLRWSVLVVPFMPMAGIALFLAWRIGQGFAPYSEVQYTFWSTTFTGPWNGLPELLRMLQRGDLTGFATTVLLLGVGIFGLVWAIRRRQTAWALYQAGLILFLLSVTMPTAPLGSFNRYILLGFPAFFALGDWMRRSRKLQLALLAVFSIAYFLLCTLYLSWVWVA